MTKSDLIDHLCEVQKMAKGRAELIVNAIFDTMEQALKRGERIEIRGLGSFEVREYKAYDGRNPRTGSRVAVKPKRLPFFKVGKELKERVNQGAVLAAQARTAKSAPTPAAVTAPPPVHPLPAPAATARAAAPSSLVGRTSVESGSPLSASPASPGPSATGVRV